ncbi:HET-domain-containing protein [Glonium stellatum]|uniref:HET-domain-containing protein n=1 Tax=Glonium stellatum TaxID=574774 RepID=A0A8E2EQP3_9PEZI|nr:HET-domain-containing protein [Glonium stellatum]
MAGQGSLTLCSVCSRIDFASYFRHEIHKHINDSDVLGATEDAVCLGPLSEIYQKSQGCAFCDLVINALNSRWSHLESPNSLSNLATKCWIFSYCCGDNSSSASNHQDKANYIRIATTIGIDPPAPAADIQLLGDDALKLGLSPLFHGRRVASPIFDMTLARKWLDICETHHGPFCETPGRQVKDRVPAPLPTHLLAIDLKEMRICHLPQAARYVALSYTWPSSQHLVLTKASLQDMFQQDALQTRIGELPGTIQDAIHCAKDLCFRYLWIDALCIIQDDDAHKAHHLPQMDHVYGAAVLTIIAAYPVPHSSLDLCKGLPGYRTSRTEEPEERLIREVKGLHLTHPSSNLEEVLKVTRWDKRSWTFQEGLLSRRSLYFTHAQTYFQCSCNVFCEDTNCEDVQRAAFVAPGTTLWNQKCPYALDKYSNSDWGTWWLSRAPFQSFLESLPAYENILGNYTSRNMSDPTDILNAFQGITSVLRLSMQTEFWYGLPERYFDLALTWTLLGPHQRRTAPIRKGQAETSKQRFPSWSWAGWVSQAELDYYFPMAGYRPEIEWFMVNEKSVALRLNTAFWNAKPDLHKHGNKDVAPPEWDYGAFHEIIPRMFARTDSDEWTYPQFLACWTTYAVFEIDGETQSLNGHERLWAQGLNLIIWDKNKVRAGSIMLDKALAFELCKSPRKFEFILIARSKRNNQTLYKSYFDETVYSDRDWCQLNVMLIERIGDVAERVAVGIIHEDAWVGANPEAIFLKLV